LTQRVAGRRYRSGPALVPRGPSADGLTADARRQHDNGSRQPCLGHECLPRLRHERQAGWGRSLLSAAPIAVVSVSAWHDLCQAGLRPQPSGKRIEVQHDPENAKVGTREGNLSLPTTGLRRDCRRRGGVTGWRSRGRAHRAPDPGLSDVRLLGSESNPVGGRGRRADYKGRFNMAVMKTPSALSRS
jgi:hypothetical protein